MGGEGTNLKEMEERGRGMKRTETMRMKEMRGEKRETKRNRETELEEKKQGSRRERRRDLKNCGGQEEHLLLTQ